MPMDDYKKIIEKLMTAIELWIENMKLDNKCSKNYLEEWESKEELKEWNREESIAEEEALDELTETFDYDFQYENT